MTYKTKEKDSDAKKIAAALEPVVSGLGFSILEFSLSRHSGSAQLRMVLTRFSGESRDSPESGQKTPSIGTEELGRVHRAVLPRLEAAMEGTDFSVECSSPGIDRTIKEGAEFVHFYGRSVRCYLPAESCWVQGILKETDEQKIILETGDGERELKYEYIAKAKLDG
jgi:ribosome maturation factor RimP